ncbi:MAG: M23 family metallopeptidase [Vicinamibacterales bacterium]
MFRWVAFLFFLLLAMVGGGYVAAGMTTPPTISIEKPDGPVGQRGTLQFTAGAARTLFADLTATIEQDGRSFRVFALHEPGQSSTSRLDADHLRVTVPIGKSALPELHAGTATAVVTATRTSFLRIRDVQTTERRQFQVMFEPPKLAVISTRHYLNQGGSELVVYRATPADVESGVRVGKIEYKGFPASGAGLSGADPSLKVAFFALLPDQPVDTPIVAFARDAAGNEAQAPFVDQVFPKAFRQSRIPVDDRFFQRVVPEILSHAPEVAIQDPNDLVAGFLAVNGELRRNNAAQITAVTENSDPTRLWQGPFKQLGNSQVEASFADSRTYLYKGKEIDKQVHLGFDLAVTAAVPVMAANDGRVVLAGYFGIYGNCVIIDHGMGVASLYGHLSSIDVGVGDRVRKGQTLGRSGMTGLAGGDHLHFTMLVRGQPVNPVEWWDPHWIADRVERKLVAAAGKPSAAAEAPASSR